MSNSMEHNWSLETFHYEPNKTWATIASVALGIICNVIGYRMWRSKSSWAWLAPTGGGLLSLGFSARSFSEKKPHILWLHVLNNVLIVAPVGGYLVFNYIVYGKIMQRFAIGQGRFALIKPEIAIKVLILCDIFNFTAQGSGAGLRATVDHQNTGRIIFLIGIITSNISYGVFVGLLTFSHRAFNRDIKFDNGNFPFRLIYVMYISSACILVRTGYRFMELKQGNDGKLVTHEKYLYIFDVIPLIHVIGVYAIFFPGSLINKAASAGEYDSINLQSRDALNV